MDKLVPAFETTLFDATLSDACADIAELGIDSLLDDGIFKSIPIVSVLVGLGKTAQNIHDRNLLRQTIKFINTFNEKSISQQKLSKYLNRINSNKKYAEEELGRVLILLNSNIDLKKSEILANFYRAYVEEKMDWSEFCELSEVISKMFLSDITLLFDINNQSVSDTSQCYAYQADRLIALGLINSTMKSIRVASKNRSYTERYLKITELGILFCEYSS